MKTNDVLQYVDDLELKVSDSNFEAKFLFRTHCILVNSLYGKCGTLQSTTLADTRKETKYSDVKHQSFGSTSVSVKICLTHE